MKTITMTRYQQALHSDEGWCTTCEDFTRFQTEPDAREYDCPECEENTVYGAEEAMLMGQFNIS